MEVTTLLEKLTCSKSFLYLLFQYHKVSAHPFLEYYAADKIFYFAPLCKQSDFFVPEVEYGLRTFASEAT